MIFYRIISRKNPTTKAVKYYAQAKSTSAVTLDQIAENISRECTVHAADTKAVLIALEEQIISALQNGNSVRLGNLGSFRLTINGKGAESKELYSTDLIRGVSVRFLRSTNMRSQFLLQNSKVKFGNIENQLSQSDTTDNPGA